MLEKIYIYKYIYTHTHTHTYIYIHVTWIILCVYSLPRLNIAEKQLAKVASSYVMGSQHCKGEEGGF